MPVDQELRKVEARILTDAGWCKGTFHIPPYSDFASFLGTREGFLTLTDVELHTGQIVPFLAFHRSAVLLIAPTHKQVVSTQNRGRLKKVRAACLLRKGFVVGHTQILESIRLSDFLGSHQGFLALEDCMIYQTGNISMMVDTITAETAPGTVLNMSSVLVNDRALVGVSEAASESDKSITEMLSSGPTFIAR